MVWFSKVKKWLKGFFKKEEAVVEMPHPAPVIPTFTVPVSVPKKESELSKKAKEVRAIGPVDLVKPAPAVKKECDHVLTFKKQTWIRVSDKKFELQNEMGCTKCDSRKILPIR